MKYSKRMRERQNKELKVKLKKAWENSPREHPSAKGQQKEPKCGKLHNSAKPSTESGLLQCDIEVIL